MKFPFRSSFYRTVHRLFVLIFLLSACLPAPAPTALPPSPTPAVISTAFTALAKGMLLVQPGCLQLAVPGGATYALLWPADFHITVEGSSITLTSGLVSGTPAVRSLQAGAALTLSGGETDSPAPELQAQVNSACPAPYWVVGGVLP